MKSKKLKICHIANADKVVNFLLLPQLKFLKKAGHEVYAVCSFGRWEEEIKRQGINIKNIKIKREISPFSDLVTLFRLFFYFKKERFDIVHTHTPKIGLLGQLAAKMAGVPVIVNTIHGLYFQNTSSILKRQFFILMEKIAALCSDLIFSQSKEDVDTVIKERIAKKEKIQYLGNGIDVEKFSCERFLNEFIQKKKEELKIPTGYKVVGVVARLVKEKGYLDLFKAFQQILKDFPKTILLVVGAKEPEKKDAVNPDVVRDFGIEKNVLFLGERMDVDEIYPLMDVFVLPSYREGMPRSVLEAMAEKRPIVATNIRGCREEVDDGENGILVPVNDFQKLSKAIAFVFKNYDKARVMGMSARVKVEKSFNENIVFDKIITGYDEVVKNKMQSKKNKIFYLFIKRILDFTLSLLLLVVFSPIFLILTVFIKLDSAGPVFYRGERIGRYGKSFKIWKFRTMVPNAENLGTIHAAKNDSRITKVGGFLRTCKLDELPQLINILKGEMSFVGPRPQVKHYVDLYSEEEKLSLIARPGMTDYATVAYINQEDLVDEKNVDQYYREKIEPLKNQLRIKYIKDSSLFMDIKIVFQTVGVIIKKNILKKNK